MFISYLAGADSSCRASTGCRAAASDGTATLGDGLLAPLLATTWAVVAIGVLIQGSLSPLLLEWLHIVPRGHEPDENAHVLQERHGIWKLLLRNTKACVG